MTKRARSPGVKRDAPTRAKGLPAPYSPQQAELIRPIYAGRLKTNGDWLRLIGKVMRAYLRGEIPREMMTAIFYCGHVGAGIATRAEEFEKVEPLRKQLAALQAGGPLPQSSLPALGFDTPGEAHEPL